MCARVCTRVGSREYLAIRKPRCGPWEKRSVSKHGPRRKQPRAQETEQTVSLTPPFLAVPSLFIDHSCERFEQPEFFFLLLLLPLFLLRLLLPLANILWIPYFLVCFFPSYFFLSSLSPLLFLSFLRFLPALVPTILGSTLLGDEKKSLVFFADLLLSRMLMSIFDVLFYSFFFFFLLFCRSDR